MFNSNIFNYINVLDRAADASWKRNELLSNNIANATTPGYKRQDIDFEEQLARAMRRSRFQTLDTKIDNLNMSRLRPKVYNDSTNFSYRLDKNNVDADTEGVKLAANQLKYNGLITAINQEFGNLKMVMR
ncbi:MAG: flagellar basal body rod protein FlgB [Lachnospiraceae bacterium]|jgi:flagellar basal-body rod protein FlgB|nr:flagellar basal body rod protein FlgB [Lachnospiraceae bacterium]